MGDHGIRSFETYLLIWLNEAKTLAYLEDGGEGGGGLIDTLSTLKDPKGQCN